MKRVARNNRVRSLVIAVTCFDSGSNRISLHHIARDWANLAGKVKVFIITNNPSNRVIEAFCAENSGLDVTVVVPNHIGHPYLLTWIHREIFREQFVQDSEVSHFLYLEDDIMFTQDNLEYYLEGLSQLGPLNLIPGFLRFEIGPNGKRYAVDVLVSDPVLALPRVVAREDYWWVNLRFAYQGFYFLDRNLFQEFMESESFGPDAGIWRIRERATQGLTFEKVPKGCFSRNFVGYRPGGHVDERALVHHVSNRYVRIKSTRFARILASEVLLFRRRTISELLRQFQRAFNINRSTFEKRPVFRIHEKS